MKNNIIIASDGNRTEVFINGKVYNDHVVGIVFSHICKKKTAGVPKVNVMTDTLPIEGSVNTDDFKTFLKKLLIKKS